MIKNKFIYSTVIISSFLTGMDAPLFLNNLQTLKEFNPNEHQIRILEQIVHVVPTSDLQSLEHSFGQANALMQNPHVNGNFLEKIKSWRLSIFKEIDTIIRHKAKDDALRNELDLQKEKLAQISSAHDSLESRVIGMHKTQSEHKEELTQQIDLKNQRTKEALTHSFEDVRQKLQSNIDQTAQRLTIHVQESEDEKIKRAAKDAIIGSDINGQRERLASLHNQNAELAEKLATLQKSQKEAHEAHIIGAEQHETAQTQSQVAAAELRQANAALLVRFQALEQARAQDAEQVRSLEQQVADQKWWNKAFLLTGVGVTATALYVIHKKANAQPAEIPDLIATSANNQNITEEKPTTSGTPAIATVSTAPAANASPAKLAADTDSIWASINKTIKYISESLTGTQTEVADLKKRMEAVEKNKLSIETYNQHMAIINKNFENQDKKLADLHNRPYPARNEHNHLNIVFPAKNNESKKVHGAKF